MSLRPAIEDELRAKPIDVVLGFCLGSVLVLLMGSAIAYFR